MLRHSCDYACLLCSVMSRMCTRKFAANTNRLHCICACPQLPLRRGTCLNRAASAVVSVVSVPVAYAHHPFLEHGSDGFIVCLYTATCMFRCCAPLDLPAQQCMPTEWHCVAATCLRRRVEFITHVHAQSHCLCGAMTLNVRLMYHLAQGDVAMIRHLMSKCMDDGFVHGCYCTCRCTTAHASVATWTAACAV